MAGLEDRAAEAAPCVAVSGGCARSPKDNVIDLILPRLLAGDRLSRADLMALAHGGLMKDVPERPFPRARVR